MATIISAFYGVDNHKGIDIANHVKSVLNGGSYVKVSNALPVGNTCYGKIKYLWVNYTYNGERGTVCIREGMELAY